jgi:hypothetical protein
MEIQALAQATGLFNSGKLMSRDPHFGHFGSGFDIFGLYQQLHAAQHSDKLVYRY